MKYFRGTSVVYAGLLTGRAASGSVTRDDNRGISSIEYNALGLPSRISVGSGSSIEYIYSADGTKLGSRYTEGRAASYALEAKQQEQSAQPYAYISEDYDYIGCYEFRNRNLFRVNTPYGYYLAGEFTPYMRDYQGNNRNEAGYYAYGLPTSDSDVKSYDPYLYGDKMLYTLKGLNIYDFLARTYAPDIARFMQPDPLATENHGVSPYTYCNGDPINFIDPTGEKVYYVDMTGKIISAEEAGKHQSFNMTELEAQYNNYDGIVIIDKDGRIVNQSEKFDEGTIQSTIENTADNDRGEPVKFTSFKIKGGADAFNIFEFLSDNITGINNIEYSIISLGKAGKNGINYVTTSHTPERESGGGFLYKTQFMYGYTVRSFYHSHKYSLEPGYGDMRAKENISNAHKRMNPSSQPIVFGIYLANSQYEKERYRRF